VNNVRVGGRKKGERGDRPRVQHGAGTIFPGEGPPGGEGRFEVKGNIRGSTVRQKSAMGSGCAIEPLKMKKKKRPVKEKRGCVKPE